jgi:TolB protein
MHTADINKHYIYFFRWSVLLLCMYAQQAQALLNIEITKSGDSALPIAIVPFGWKASSGAAPTDIAEIVIADLERTGQFRAMKPADMLQQPHSGQDVRFENWRITGVGNLVVGSIRPFSKDKYIIEFQLFDVFKERQMIGHSFTVPTKELRGVAHSISDLVYEAITGERGAFNTRIAYVAALNKNGKREYRLEVSDTDGYNARTLIRSPQPIMSPSWSPDGRSLAYVSFENRRSQVYVQPVFGGDDREQIAAFEGINSAPVWSPDGRSLALTLSRDGNADIYIMDLASKRVTRVTNTWAIDTEPAWMPDGKTLLFTSGRSGNPQIYRMTLPDGKPERLTFEGDYNASPVVSPDGRSVAMVHRSSGNYRIAVLDLKSRLFRVLTDGRLDETPSFAPNGSIVLYASQQGQQGVLAAVSIDGRTRQRLALHEGDIREPTWAPFVSDSRR